MLNQSEKLTTKEIIAYVAALLAIGFGVLLLWSPPAALAAPGNVAVAMAFITGGFATLGVSIALPVAYRSGVRAALSSMAAQHGQLFSGTAPTLGGQPAFGHGYFIVKANQGQPVNQVRADVLRAVAPHRQGGRLIRVSTMDDPSAPSQGGQRQPGDTIVTSCDTHDPFASEQAHLTLSRIAADITTAVANRGTVAHFCCVSDM